MIGWSIRQSQSNIVNLISSRIGEEWQSGKGIKVFSGVRTKGYFKRCVSEPVKVSQRNVKSSNLQYLLKFEHDEISISNAIVAIVLGVQVQEVVREL